MSDTDAIVVDLDGGEMLQDCVDSIARQTLPPRRIVVFDNGSRVPVVERLRGEVTVIRSETNRGFAAAVNEAVRGSNAPFFALVNNDALLEPRWLETLRKAFDEDPKLAAAQTVILRDAATIDGAGIDIGDGTFRQIGHGAPAGSPLPSAWGVSATAALYRRAAVGETIFDESFFAWYEDVDLCARLHRGGWRMAVLPQALATHRGSASAPLLGRRALRLRTRNRYRVARRHPGVGRISALLLEDVRLALKGRTSWVGVIEGLLTWSD